MRLEGKTALVTGGGTGIGAAIAERFVAEGARVCITGRRQEKLEEEAGRYPAGLVTICAGDVSNHEDVKRMVEATVALGGSVDILVNNAAAEALAPIADLDPADWQRVLDVNLTGPFLLTKETLPHMMKRGSGSIINISSLGGLRCVPGCAAYGTTKAGLIRLTQQTALEYGSFAIRCNAICPGATRTQILEEAMAAIGRGFGMDAETALAKLIGPVPLQRAADPTEMAGTCVYLASDESSYMTGAVLVLDGGASIVDVSFAALG